MEVSAASRLISTVPHRRSFHPNPSFLHPQFFTQNLALASLSNSGSICFASHLPKATTSEETSTSLSEEFDKVHDGDTNDQSSPFDVQAEAIKILDKLNGKLGAVDPYPILVYGSSALAALYVSSAIVGAINSIPVLPKVLEVVGLGFTIWFSYRYLILKKNREELSTKIEEIKKEIIGSD